MVQEWVVTWQDPGKEDDADFELERFEATEDYLDGFVAGLMRRGVKQVVRYVAQ